jgi:hypothetical protein
MTRRFLKSIDLIKAQKAFFEQQQLSMRDGHRMLAMQGLADAKELTSGSLTRAQTKGAFARGAAPAQSTLTGRRRALGAGQRAARGLAGHVPALPINIQTGRLNRSHFLRQSSGRGIQSFDLTQHNPGGGIFRLMKGGTRKMTDSGYSKEIARRWRARNKAYLDHYSAQQRRS